ncbi:MAG: SPFH domain-containing protein [Prolixibacteraceae bacterium]|jgi:regulator of protease activity HflC (stomatin/prohibitin superfamily)|nr:SPFH domain-containing protein [Prolixibacteraceae bacterium]
MELLIPILIAIAVFIIAGFRIAQEYERAIVFRLGRYQATKGPGLYWIIPLIDRQQTTTVILMPSEFSNAARSFTEMVSKQAKPKE